MRMLDAISLVPGLHDRAFQEFHDGKATYEEALQVIARQLLAAGWLPPRRAVSCVVRWVPPTSTTIVLDGHSAGLAMSTGVNHTT